MVNESGCGLGLAHWRLIITYFYWLFDEPPGDVADVPPPAVDRTKGKYMWLVAVAARDFHEPFQTVLHPLGYFRLLLCLGARTTSGRPPSGEQHSSQRDEISRPWLPCLWETYLYRIRSHCPSSDERHFFPLSFRARDARSRAAIAWFAVGGDREARELERDRARRDGPIAKTLLEAIAPTAAPRRLHRLLCQMICLENALSPPALSG